MEQLLVLIPVVATGAAFLTRRSISRRVAARIGVVFIIGLLVSGLGLGLLLDGLFSPFHPYLWGPLLMGIFFVSLCGAPFAIFPLLKRRTTAPGGDRRD